jgi:hypothetical protein
MVSDNRQRGALAELGIAALVLIPAYFVFYRSISGDACIYFTYFRNFFSLPFSFQTHTISFGAASPLHVIINAPIHALFGHAWLPIAKAVNLLLVAIGIVFLNRATKGDLAVLLLTGLLALLSPTLFLSVSQLYEVGLAFLAISIAYYLLKCGRRNEALVVSGLLCLVRPELIVVTIALDVYILVISEDRKKTLLVILCSLIPLAAYHLYMHLGTGELIPSNIIARAFRAQESGVPWPERAAFTWNELRASESILYILAILAIVFMFVEKKIRTQNEEFLLLLPLVMLYLIFPPGRYIARYLLPIVPMLIVLIVETARPILRSRYSIPVLLVLILAAYAAWYSEYSRNPRYDLDRVLLRDLAGQLNELADSEDRVLLYEIQGQYSIDAVCVSADATVGGQMLDAVMGRRSFEDAIWSEGIRFVVTSNVFNYRSIFNDTLLESLYLHDLSSSVGDTTEVRGIRFRKVLTNEAFSDPAQYAEKAIPSGNVADTVRVYGDGDPLMSGSHFFWNSVYEIISE